MARTLLVERRVQRFSGSLPGDSKITLSGGNPDEVVTDAQREERGIKPTPRPT